MKKLLLTSMMLTAMIFSNEIIAQVRVNVNLNIGQRPGWGVPGNYSGDYYYLPEIDCYYDIPGRQFIYFDGFDWAFADELPYRFRGYNLYSGYKIVVNEPRPYMRAQFYRERYSRYCNTYRPPVIIANRYPDQYPNRQIKPYDNSRYGQGGQHQHYDNKRDEEARYKGNNRDRDDDRDQKRNAKNDRGNGHGNGHGNGRRN